MPAFCSAAATTGTSICTSLSAARRTDGVCAYPTIAISVAPLLSSARWRSLGASEDVLLELFPRHVRLAARLERLDRRTDSAPTAIRHTLGAALVFRLPHRAHAQSRTNLVVWDADDVLATEIAVGTVEEHRRVYERLGLLLAVVRDGRDDREPGQGPGVGDGDLVVLPRGDDAQRAVALARHVHTSALGTLVAEDATVDQRIDVPLENRRELLFVAERDEVFHHQRLLRGIIRC